MTEIRRRTRTPTGLQYGFRFGSLYWAFFGLGQIGYVQGMDITSRERGTGMQIQCAAAKESLRRIK
jgi:hypothetical protein